MGYCKMSEEVRDDIEGIWFQLNVLRTVLSKLIAREAARADDPEGALRGIADDLHAYWDYTDEVSEQQRRINEPARSIIDDIMAEARLSLDKRD
jgi:chloramphenicol 3-O-phosphotransferase